VVPLQAWGVMEFRRGNVERARELFQEGVWADSSSRDVAYVWQVGLMRLPEGPEVLDIVPV